MPKSVVPEFTRLESIDSTAERLSICTKEVRRLCDRGELFSVRLGRRRLIPGEEVDAYIGRLAARARGQVA